MPRTVTAVTSIYALTLIEYASGETVATLMGYSLPLSCEELLLLRICVSREKTEGVFGSTQFRTVMLNEYGLGSSDQISVLVNRINRKAKAISGRKLLLGVSHHGFFLNPYM